MRVAAEFKAEDMAAVVDLMNSGEFSLDGLITHRMDASDADQAYRIAFSDASCLKMILDWRGCA
jgi:3-hydroxyethyl bacteriochlorophyllide a dehydrogenase